MAGNSHFRLHVSYDSISNKGSKEGEGKVHFHSDVYEFRLDEVRNRGSRDVFG